MLTFLCDCRVDLAHVEFKVTVYLQIGNCLQISIFFGLINDPNEISNVEKKSLKKKRILTEKWQFYVMAGSKNYPSD